MAKPPTSKKGSSPIVAVMLLAVVLLFILYLNVGTEKQPALRKGVASNIVARDDDVPIYTPRAERLTQKFTAPPLPEEKGGVEERPREVEVPTEAPVEETPHEKIANYDDRAVQVKTEEVEPEKSSKSFLPSLPHKPKEALAMIIDGEFEKVDVSYINRMHSTVLKDVGRVTEGHSGELVKERQIYAALASMQSVKRICEIGFNAGHSASLWLLANPTAEVIMFDIWMHDYNVAAEKAIRSEAAKEFLTNADERLKIVKGSSLETVSRFAAENPDIKCDIVSVDGGHTFEIASQDIENMKKLANPDFHVMLIDDTNCQMGYCVDQALNMKIDAGLLKPVLRVSEHQVAEGYARGVTVCQYTFQAPTRIPVLPTNPNEALARVIDGDWERVDVGWINNMHDRILSNVGKVTEGHSGQLVKERQIYATLASMKNVKRICEIGFNAGHSASLWLLANPTAEVIMFDIWMHDYNVAAENAIRSEAAKEFLTNADERLKIVKGSSLETVPKFASENPDIKCDIVSVDGGHTFEIASQDIENMKKLANPDFHVMLIDDTNCQMGYCVDRALNSKVDAGLLKPVLRASEHKVAEGYARGVTVCQYLFSADETKSSVPSADSAATPFSEDGRKNAIPALPEDPQEALAKIVDGAWEKVDIKWIDKMKNKVFVNLSFGMEGHSAQLIKERQLYTALASMKNVKRICEIGFNAGHSAGLWLLANPTAKVIMFDIWHWKYNQMGVDSLLSDVAKEHLNDVAGRLSIIKGPSSVTVPQFAANHPDEKCDIVSVDGGHSFYDAVNDMKNMEKLANPDFSVMLLDDTNCQRPHCVDPALDHQINTGLIKPFIRISEEEWKKNEVTGVQMYGRGVTMCQYTSVLRRIEERKRLAPPPPPPAPISDEQQQPKQKAQEEEKPATGGDDAQKEDVPPLPPLPDDPNEALQKIVDGAWEKVDINWINEMKSKVFVNLSFGMEGHSGQLIKERQLYAVLASMKSVKTICEIGFNAGHSAGLWLFANPTAKVYMFDKWEWKYNQWGVDALHSDVAKKYLGDHVKSRLTVIKGSSSMTVPKFAREHPDVKCDIISVDGGHSFGAATTDMENMKQLRNPDFSVMLLDDTNCQRPHCVDRALNHEVSKGLLKPLLRLSEEPWKPNELTGKMMYGRGVTLCQYNDGHVGRRRF